MTTTAAGAAEGRVGILRRRSTAAVLALVAVLVAPAPAPHAAPLPPSTAVAELDDLFHAYGDAPAASGQRHWTGGDTTFSVPLPDGRTVWIFSDTFLSPTDACGPSGPSPCHRRGMFTPLVNNTFVVQEGDRLVRTLHGGHHSFPEALIKPPLPHGERSFYWMGDGVVEGDELRVFVHRYPKIGTLPPSAEATDVATFSLPDLTLRRIDEGLGAGGLRPWAFAPPGSGSPVPVTWGAAILERPDFTYVYGTEEYPTAKHLHVARVPRGQLLTAPWEHFDGAGWSTDPLRSARVLSDVAGELSVVETTGGFRLVASRGGIGDVHVHRAPQPQGPWDAGTLVLAPPERARGAWVYNAHEHPQHSRPGKVVLSYNVNGSIDGRDVYADTHVYRPRFVEVDLGDGAAVVPPPT